MNLMNTNQSEQGCSRFVRKLPDLHATRPSVPIKLLRMLTAVLTVIMGLFMNSGSAIALTAISNNALGFTHTHNATVESPTYAMGIVAGDNGFTGTFTIDIRQFDRDGNLTASRQLPVGMSPTRIKISAINSVDPSPITSNLGARDLYVRLDRDDFVFTLDNNQGIVVRKSDVQQLMNLASGFGANRDISITSAAVDYTVTPTNETRRINGYNTRKFILREQDSTVEHHVWVTRDLNIDLGNLAGAMLGGLPGSDIVPFYNSVGHEGVPLVVESYRNSARVGTIEITNIATGINPSSVDVPTGTRLMTLQEMILQRMRQY